MDYLKGFIGRQVTVSLNDSGKKSRLMILFFETDSNDGLIMNKLLSVDGSGIWIEGFKKATRYVDDSGNPIPLDKQVLEDVTVSVLIPYNFLEGVFFINDSKYDPVKIGF